MSIDLAIREMTRILKPGGELIVVGNTLYSFAWESLRNGLGQLKWAQTKPNFFTVINTVYYQCTGRYIKHDSRATTGTPIYPSYHYMRKLLKKEGLVWNQELTCIVASGETVLVANK